VGQYAIRCSGYFPSAGWPHSKPQPLNYSVDDIGKLGVPVLTHAQRATIARIQQRLLPTPRHLRFAFVEIGVGSAARVAPRGSSYRILLQYVDLLQREYGAEFIVYDAVGGPCLMAAPGYHVLNDTRPSRNEFYQPGENPYSTHSIPGDTHPEQSDNY
jgi:hypothetical protein